ncbi:MAG: VWA domain-containing protein [Chlorobi bacterium]|nr:VWA domain-containing protein [Chlorobiota bacterium]
MIRFANIEYFWFLLLAVVFFVLYLLFNSWKKTASKNYASTKQLDGISPNSSEIKPVFKFILLLTGLVFIVIALVDPQIGSKLEKVKREGIDLMLVLDVSNSMMAEDIKPNRLVRSKMAISNLIDKLEGDRIGIIVFAGNAYKQLPLTTDYSAAKLFLSAVDTKIVPSQGTAIGEAIDMSVESFDEQEHNKAIIIITDGENHEDDAVESAKKAYEQGIKVFTIGMGLPDGAPIPIYNDYGGRTGFKKDKEGKTVVTKLDEDMLRQIAAAGNGAYARANNGSSGLSKIFNEINSIQKKEIESKQFTDYEHRFQIYIIAALIILLVELLIGKRKSKWAGKVDLFGKMEKK